MFHKVFHNVNNVPFEVFILRRIAGSGGKMIRKVVNVTKSSFSCLASNF